MSALSTSSYRPGIILCLVIFLVSQSTHSAPVYEQDTTQVAEYDGGATGCYYNFQHYQEGDRIITNEPCLNCTCHNRMLMCYLRVCPFSKAIGQDCTVEKRPDQCCPVITCPEVPVQLLTSTTNTPALSDSTEVGFHDNYGCKMDDRFYPDGAQLPIDYQSNPCELCYCIRNRTACVIQQCTLRVAGCRPVYKSGVCCPVKYDCEYDEGLETTVGPGLIMTTTIAPGAAPQCYYEGKVYEDGELIYSTQPCQHCYCFRGDIACAVQDCGTPMKTHGKNCTALPPPEGECCPTTYQCEDDGLKGIITIPEGMEQTSEISQVQPMATIPENIEEAEKQEHEVTSESFIGADNMIPQDHEIKVEHTEEPVKAEKSAETTEKKDVPESETTHGSEEVTLPEEHETKPAPVDEETQIIQDQKTETPTLIEETEKHTSIEQTEAPLPTEKITVPTYTETSEMPFVAENTEKLTTIEKTEPPVSGKETEVPIVEEQSESSSVKSFEGEQEATEISITENIPTSQSSVEGLNIETETSTIEQKIEQPESIKENVTVEEQPITTEGPVKTEELTESPISEQEHTESSYESVPPKETTNAQEPIEESGKSTEAIVPTEEVSEKTMETIDQDESIKTKPSENEEQATLETKETGIPQEVTEIIKEATTSKQEEATTLKSEEATTSKSEEATTLKSEEATTSKSEEATTLKSEEATTLKSEEATTSKSEEATTSKSEEAITSKPEEAITSKPEEAITSKPEEATTSKPEEVPTEEIAIPASPEVEPVTSEKPVEVSESGEIKPAEITTNLPQAQETDQQYPSSEAGVEKKPEIPEPELGLKDKLPPLAPKKDDFGLSKEEINQQAAIEGDHETEKDKPISESTPGYKAEDKESIPEIYSESNIDTKKPEMHIPESLVTEIPEKVFKSETDLVPQSETSTEHEENKVTTEIKTEEPILHEVTPGQEEISTAEITPIALDTKTSEPQIPTEAQTIQEELQHTEKSIVPEDYSTSTVGLEVPSTEKITTVEELPTKGLTLDESGETSSEEVTSDISNDSEEAGKEHINEEGGESEDKLHKPSPGEISTESSISEQESTSSHTITSTEETQVTIKETEQKESTETSKVDQPNVTEQNELTETPEVSEPSVTQTVSGVEISETEAPEETQTVKATEPTAVSEEGTIASETATEENITKKTEEASTEKHIPEVPEITESTIPEEMPEQSVIPDNKPTESVEQMEVQTSVPPVIEEEPSITEKSTEIPSLVETEHKSTLISEETATQKSEEENKSEGIPTKGIELTEETLIETQMTEKSITEEESKEEKETESSVTDKYVTTETSTVVGKGAEDLSNQSNESISEGGEQEIQKPSSEDKISTEATVEEEKEIVTPLEKEVTEIITEKITTQISITEQPEVSTVISTAEQNVSEDKTTEKSSEHPVISESTTELISETVPPVSEMEVPVKPHTEEKQHPEIGTSVTEELSTETSIQQDESTSIEPISEEQKEISSTTKISSDIDQSTPQPEESSIESTEAVIAVESSTTTKEQEIEEHTKGIFEEKPSEEEKHELPSSVETSTEVPVVKEMSEIPETEEKLHETTIKIDEEKATTEPVETHEKQSTISPYEEKIPAVELTSPSSTVTEVPSERPIEHSTEQEYTNVTEVMPINEITESEESKPIHPDIPGEGNCLVDGQSYSNNSAIPPANPCQLSCQCISSIIQCELMQCPPPPTHLSNCMPIHASGSACCPIYTCDSTPTVELEADNHIIEHQTLKYEEEELKHTTLIPKITEIPPAPSDHTVEEEGQEHVSPHPHIVLDNESETRKEMPPVEEQVTDKPITSISEEPTIIEEHKTLEEVPSKETSNVTPGEQSTEFTLSTTTQKIEEVTEQEQGIVKLLPSTEESIVEQTTEKESTSFTVENVHETEIVTHTSAPVTIKTETAVSVEESEKIPEEKQQTIIPTLPKETTEQEETVSESSIPSVSEPSNEVIKGQSKESETPGDVQEVSISTEHGITATEEEITQSTEIEGQTKPEIESTEEKKPEEQTEVTFERPAEQESTDITKLITTSEITPQVSEETETKPIEHKTVETESETSNINTSESTVETSTEFQSLNTEEQTDISETATITESKFVSSDERITTPTSESSHSTEVQEGEISHEDKDKTIEQTTKSILESTETPTQQPKDKTDVPLESEEQVVVHTEETPKSETSEETESSTSTKAGPIEPSVTEKSETSVPPIEENTESIISVETQTSTFEEHKEIEEITEKSESTQKEEKPVEFTTEKEASEPTEVAITEQSIPSIDLTTATIEKHVTKIEEQTTKSEEEPTKGPVQEQTTLPTSPIQEEISEITTPKEEKTSESIPIEGEHTEEKTTEEISQSTITEEQTISPGMSTTHVEEKQQQPEEITQKPLEKEISTSASITEAQPILPVSETTEQHPVEEVSVGDTISSTERPESVTADVTEQAEQAEEQKPKDEEQVHKEQTTEISEVNEVTEISVNLEEKTVESVTPQEKPIEAPTPEIKPVETSTSEEQLIESSTLEERPIETSTSEEQPIESSTLEEKPIETSMPEKQPIESSTLEEKPIESSTSEEQPIESPTPGEQPIESPTPEEKPIESSTPQEQPIESSTSEEKPVETSTSEEQLIESSTPEEKPIESSTSEEQPIESPTPGEQPIESPTSEEKPIESPTPEEKPIESSTSQEQPIESSTSEEGTIEISTVDEKSSEVYTQEDKIIESSTLKGLESTSQEKPVESLTPEEKPVEQSTPEEKFTETEQKTEAPISEEHTFKPSTYEGETEKTSEGVIIKETQTVAEESVSEIPVKISPTETVQIGPIEEQTDGEAEKHFVTPIKEEKLGTPESTESILVTAQIPSEETAATDHTIFEEKATTISSIQAETIQPTEAPVPVEEASSKGEIESAVTKLQPVEVSSEISVQEQSTIEPVSEESITKSEEAQKGEEKLTEPTIPEEEHVSTSLSSITEEPEDKITGEPVVTEEHESEILPEEELETTQLPIGGFDTKLQPIPTEAPLTETSEEISEKDHEEGHEEVQPHVGIIESESSSQIPQTDKSEGQSTIGSSEEHLQPVNHTIETAEEPDKPILEEHHVTSTSTIAPQTGVEYPEQTVSGEDNSHFPINTGSYLNPDEDYDEDDQAIYGPGTCRYGGKVYMSAQQIPRDDPCDFCFCFRSDIICLQQSCPPPIPGCHEEPISGFCCPRYECPVSMATSLNITTTTTTTTTTLPPHFLTHAYKGAAKRNGCQIRGQAYSVGETIKSASGPCLHCTCGGDGNMKCDPRVCSPEPMLRQMIAAATARRRR
ncbi:titin isoform X1 [Polistes fuscatus]|uniref:titin isoform X1 n=1 Tax=Polistes fuscatus TaxID=30207 RepID=UPI001CA7DD03|nr:titin isoform X1 [Polistes fuscatus]